MTAATGANRANRVAPTAAPVAAAQAKSPSAPPRRIFLPHPGGAQGFTLLELAVVMVMLGLLAGMAAPSVLGMLARQQLRAASAELQADVALARQRAEETGRPMVLQFKPGGDWCYALRPESAAVAEEGDVCGLARSGQDGVVKRVGVDRFPRVVLTQAQTMVLHPSAHAPRLHHGQAAFASLRGERVRVRLGAMGRASLCTPNGTQAMPGLAACAEDEVH